jgi:putative ABC transport system permease protein
MNIDQKVIEKLDVIKTAFRSNPNVLAVAEANASPVNIVSGYSMRADAPGGKDLNTRGNPIDEDYIEATGLQIIAGTNFTRQDMIAATGVDEEKRRFKFILNETAVRAMGWSPDEAIGKRMFLGDQRPGEVAAVVKDFHFASLKSPIEPLVMFPADWASVLVVKVKGDDIPATLSFLSNQWKTLINHRPFDFRFMDDDFNKLYTSERRTARVFNIFAGIAILLACLGLFGLSAYAAKQRTKEIGVRKVLGASSMRIVVLLSNSFVRLVAISFLIAAPVAWWAMNRWLQDFSYRIHVSWWMFVLAGTLGIGIALLTVSVQAVKSALSNPVKSLRTE